MSNNIPPLSPPIHRKTSAWLSWWRSTGPRTGHR